MQGTDAVKEIHEETGETYNWGVYAYEVSCYAGAIDESECLAECVGYYYNEGEDAAILAKKVWKILKRELG